MRVSNALTRDQVIAEIFRGKGELSLRQYAIQLGISAMYLSDLQHGKRDPGDNFLRRFGIRKVRSVAYRYERTKGRQA